MMADRGGGDGGPGRFGGDRDGRDYRSREAVRAEARDPPRGLAGRGSSSPQDGGGGPAGGWSAAGPRRSGAQGVLGRPEVTAGEGSPALCFGGWLPGEGRAGAGGSRPRRLPVVGLRPAGPRAAGVGVVLGRPAPCHRGPRPSRETSGWSLRPALLGFRAPERLGSQASGRATSALPHGVLGGGALLAGGCDGAELGFLMRVPASVREFARCGKNVSGQYYNGNEEESFLKYHFLGDTVLVLLTGLWHVSKSNNLGEAF